LAKVNRASSPLIPLYQQISESIIRDIAAGRFVAGDRLPTERELAKEYRTTVRTLRKALKELETTNVLERIQGSGNYVRSNKLTHSIYSMFRLDLPTAEVISVTELNKPRSLPAFGTAEKATRVRRLRSLDNIPIAVEEIWLDLDAGKINKKELGDSLYKYYQVKLGFWIHRAEDKVTVQTLPQWTPESFENDHSRMFGYIERLSWAQHKTPVECSRTWFNPIKACYVQRL